MGFDRYSLAPPRFCLAPATVTLSHAKFSVLVEGLSPLLLERHYYAPIQSAGIQEKATDVTIDLCHQ